MVRIQRRRDTSVNWLSFNPTLQVGEEGFETDTKKKKTGDGITPWSSLPYDNTISLAPDGPGPLLGNALKSIRLNADETAFEWYYPGAGTGGTNDHYMLAHIGLNTHYQIDSFIASKGSPNGIAPLNSPSFSGQPEAPTAAFNTNTTQLATCAFVQAAIGSGILYSSTSSNVTLPSSPTKGQTCELVGDGYLWTINAPSGHRIRLGDDIGGKGGKIQSTDGFDCIHLIYIGPILGDPTWLIKTATGILELQ